MEHRRLPQFGFYFSLLAVLNGMPLGLRDTAPAACVVGRSGVVALAHGLGHDAIAIPTHDEGVAILVSVVHGLSC